MVKHAKLEVASYVQQIAEDVTRQRAMERPESFLAEVEILMPQKRKVLSYHPSLPAKDLAHLVDTYPGIDFQASTEMLVCNDHELAAIARRAATYSIYSRMDAFVKVETLDRSDIGGNEELSFNHDTRVHYCRMTMDVRDDARNTRRAIALQNADVMRPGLAKIFRPGGSRVCTTGAENCPVVTPIVCEIHVYDIPMSTRAKIFDRKQVVVDYTVFNFMPMILVADSGYNPTSQYYYQKADGKIKFWFLNSAADVYEHDYETYIAPIRETVLVTPQGRVYHIEKSRIHMGQIDVTYTEATSLVVEKVLEDAKSECRIPMEWENYRVFPYLDMLPGRLVLTASDFVIRYDCAPTDFVERAIRVGLSSRRKPDGPFAINDQLQSLNTKRIIDGTVMKPGSEVSQETLSHLTVYVMFNAVYSTRSVNLVTDTVERLCPKKGATEATFTEMLRAEWSFFRVIWDILYPEITTEEKSDMNIAFSNNYLRYVRPDIVAIATAAPEQLFTTFTSTTLPAGVPQMFHAIDPAVIARHQLSHELARRILAEKPDPPRVILSTQDRLSTRQFKVATRIHPGELLLRQGGRFQVLYLPPNVTSLIQPMDQRVISNMKRFYRGQLLSDLLNKDNEAAITRQEYLKSYTIGDARLSMIDCWQRVLPSTVANSFNKVNQFRPSTYMTTTTVN